MNDTLEKTVCRQTKVQNALVTILSDAKFVAAPQMTAFLRYVVNQTLDGQSSRIKAYTVAVDALGKPPTFDPQNDPSVRVLAKRLRSSLDQYYARNPEVTLKIEMKAGSYIPAFVDNKDREIAEAELPQKANSQEASAATLPRENASTTGTQQYSGRQQTTQTSADVPAALSDQQTDTPLSVEVALKNVGQKKPATTPLLSNTVNNTPVDTNTPVNRLAGKLFRIPRFALALPVLVGILWFAVNKDSATDSHTLAAAMPEVSTQGVSNAMATLDISRSRPTMPTILIAIGNSTAYPCHLIADTLSTALLGSSAVDIYRETAQGRIELVWPEDYLLSVSSVNVGDQARVSVQLLQAQSGRVIQADTMMFDASAEAGFSIENVATIEAIANSFIDSNSPLMQSFNSIQDDSLQTDGSSHDI
ncbi:MAG: hypothetical protein V3U76_13200 [Granulosicoccus sp.]